MLQLKMKDQITEQLSKKKRLTELTQKLEALEIRFIENELIETYMKSLEMFLRRKKSN